MSSYSLFKTRRFAPLFATQFLGAFNDNLFKNALILTITFQAVTWTSLPASLLAPFIGAVFILPFIVLSGTAGVLADRLDKSRIARWVKVWEMLLMLLASVGFYYHSLAVLLWVIFGLGVHSTFFGPIKYALLPQHLREHELLTGNALIESGTFIAILLGTIAGGLLSGFEISGWWISLLALGIAWLGWLASRQIPAALPVSVDTDHAESLHPWRASVQILRLAYQDRAVWWSLLGISWFWLYGALLLAHFPSLVQTHFQADSNVVTLLLAMFSIGIGTGALVCDRLSRHHLQLWFVVVGSCVMAISGIDFALRMHEEQEMIVWAVLVDLFLLGFGGGMFTVPLYTFMQLASDPTERGRIISANNLLNALWMVVGSVLLMIMIALNFPVDHLFFVLAMLTVVVGLWVYQRMIIGKSIRNPLK